MGAKELEALRRSGEEMLALSSAVSPTFEVVRTRALRDLFDHACDAIHYAGSCRRVGRCMRLALVVDGEWAGGTVLGSPFPNIGARDQAFGLTEFTRGYRERGLLSPWATENRDYWDRLQLIVNHARTFIFPRFQGRGLGIQAVALLRSDGLALWQMRYGNGAIGFDTHCTSPTSRLFAANGWSLVGRTKGFTRDPRSSFSGRVGDNLVVKDNAGLVRRRRNPRWWTWVVDLRTAEDAPEQE